MKWMGWNHADLLSAPESLVNRIIYHINNEGGDGDNAE
jgi:hypothetical protein